MHTNDGLLHLLIRFVCESNLERAKMCSHVLYQIFGYPEEFNQVCSSIYIILKLIEIKCHIYRFYSYITNEYFRIASLSVKFLLLRVIILQVDL